VRDGAGEAREVGAPVRAVGGVRLEEVAREGGGDVVEHGGAAVGAPS
jgi:hypothetical protein